MLIFNYIQLWMAGENFKLYVSFVILLVKKKRSAEADRDQHTETDGQIGKDKSRETKTEMGQQT